MKVEAIPQWMVERVWHDAEPQLRRACDRTGERTTRDVLAQLMDGNAQLWHCGDGWAVTQIDNYPLKRVCTLTLFGGKFDFQHAAEMRGVLERWARHYLADEIRIVGRRGWLKLLPDFHETTVLTLCLSQ